MLRPLSGVMAQRLTELARDPLAGAVTTAAILVEELLVAIA